MASEASIKLTKSFTYRGAVRKWSNTYHFKTGLPADFSHWHALAAAIILVEKTVFTSDVTIVGGTGYAAGSAVPVYTETFSTAGTLSPSTSVPAPGDAALLLRYSTTARTGKNHPVYLWNYFHGARLAAAGGDTPYAAQVTALGSYASNWISGFSDGTNTYVRTGPNGATATGSLVETYVTHRDFPR